MPGFVRSKEDEEKWGKAKDAASKQTDKGSDSYWALSNYIFHRMKKSEEDQQLASYYKSEFYKAAFGGMMQLGLGEKPVHTDTQQVNVKTPKTKAMHPSLQKLRDFLLHKKGAR